MPPKSPPPSARRARPRPGLRLIMLLAGLIIMAMPLSGLYLFRIYENELVRQTEAELIAQAAVVGAMFKKAALDLGGPAYGRKLSGLPPAPAGPLTEVLPRLDLSRDEIRPRQKLEFKPSPFEPDPAATLAAAGLEDVLAEAGRTNLSSVSVLDFHGLVVAGASGHGLLPDTFEVTEALNGHYQSVLRERAASGRAPLSSSSRGARFRVFVALPIMNGDRLVGVVHLSRTPREILKALYAERRNAALAGVMSLGLVAVVSLMVSLLIVTPIKRLADESKTVADGHSAGFKAESVPIVVREVAELRAVVADMAERLRRRSDYLKAFASGVSHEFKTPLTSIKGALELLGEHGAGMDAATRARFEDNIRADLDRLERLVGRLLALARAEARTLPAADADHCDAAGLARRLAGHYHETAFQVAVDAPPGPLDLAVSAEVLETVLRNLFDNSQAAGATGTRVELGYDGFQRHGLIRVTDNGPGIPEETAENLFTPFYTTKKNRGGTGLGLSLARTLLAPHRGELTWVGNDPGAAFLITLPLWYIFGH